MSRVRVAILGASGLVSQRMQQRLSMHPWFELVAVAGRATGTKLSDVDWCLDEPRPQFIDECDINILDIHDEHLSTKLLQKNVQVVFSALPSQPAITIEADLVKAGLHVFSNASAYRMHADVALVVADVNPDALVQPEDGQALHACATNCTLIPILHPLSVLKRHYTITTVVVRSEQALSGAGWTLLHDAEKRTEAINKEIQGEADKIIEEIERILHLDAIMWDVQCKRVDKRDGHIVHVDVHLVEQPTMQSVVSILENIEVDHLNPLPSQPEFSMTLKQSELIVLL